LIIGPSNIGDALLCLPVIHLLCTAYAGAHITLMVGDRAQALFRDDSRIKTLVSADAYSGFWGRLRLLKQAIGFLPHVLVDLRSTLLPLFLRPWRMGAYYMPPPAQLKHMRDRHLWKLARQVPHLAEQTRNLPEQGLFFTSRDEEQVEALWRRWHIRCEQPVIVICPGARSHIKRWRAEGFARVADRMIADWDAQVIFSGEPAEREIVEGVRKQMARPAHTAVGLITIRQLGLLMQRVDAVLTNDSAALHMASVVNAPTVAIFGPTDAEAYGPRAELKITLRRRLFCAPCRRALCHYSHECMRFVSEDEVYSALAELLGNSDGHPP
jgi:ADP-heptose:LPS heptosyltransferase